MLNLYIFLVVNESDREEVQASFEQEAALMWYFRQEKNIAKVIFSFLHSSILMILRCSLLTVGGIMLGSVGTAYEVLFAWQFK